MIRSITLGISTWIAATAVSAPPINVIMVAGQSNAVGFDAPPRDLPPSELDSKIRFWWRCGDPPPDDHDSSSGGWRTLQPQPRGNPIKPRQPGDRQYGNFAQDSGGFGPEFGLARTLASESKTPLAVIKIAFSGTHVAGDWNPNLAVDPEDRSETDSRGACYRSLVAEASRALDALAQEYEPRIKALVWVQGESDATAQRVERYQLHLTEMIAALRRDLQVPNLVVLLGVNTEFQAGSNKYMAGVIDAQKACAEEDQRVVYVDTSGASIANRVHFDAFGTLDVGRRFAKALDAFSEL